MNKYKLIGAAVVVVVAVGVYSTIDALRKVGSNKGYEPDQPIAFSHKIHAGDNEINCKYCHYGAEKGRHAGIPAVSVCMNCHTQVKPDSPEIQKLKKAVADKKSIEWIKVNRMADFVYFNHSQHVVAGKVDCMTCHGPVNTMTRMRQEQDFTMGWCIDCHRKSDVVIHGATTTTKASDAGGQDCAKCHY